MIDLLEREIEEIRKELQEVKAELKEIKKAIQSLLEGIPMEGVIEQIKFYFSKKEESRLSTIDIEASIEEYSKVKKERLEMERKQK